MIAVEDGWASFRFSTDGLPEGERAKAVRELYERTTVPGKIEPLEPLPNCSIRADIAKRTLPGLGVMSGTLCGLRQAARPRGAVSSNEDDLVLAVNLRGNSIAQQGDRELRLADGDALLATRGAEGFAIVRPTSVRFIGMRVPRRAIAPLVGRLVHDLIAATVGATRDALASAERRGIRAARLRAMMADITVNLDDCDLKVADVAQRQRVTTRYVHKLFEREGLTFSAFVLDRRLSRAHRFLSEPRLADLKISSVAFDVGFGDLSYFNRVFRRRYGATPSEIRRAAKRGDLPHDLGSNGHLRDGGWPHSPNRADPDRSCEPQVWGMKSGSRRQG